MDNLPIDDALNLYETLRSGLWGVYGETYRCYNNYLSMHMNKEVAVAVASGKKYKATKALEFHELFPIVDDYMTLGQGKLSRKKKTKSSIATKALLAIPSEGAPEWLRKVAEAEKGNKN